MHQLAPLAGRRLLLVHAFLFAAASDAELDTAAQAHEVQAAQLRDPHVRSAWQVVDPLRFIPGRGRPDLPLAELLALAPEDLAATVRASWPQPA